MQPNKMIVEKQCEMGRPLGKDEWRQTSKESRGEKTSTIQEKGEATANVMPHAKTRLFSTILQNHFITVSNRGDTQL